MSLRPSSLPMLQQCPCFESDSTEFAKDGNKRHDYLSVLLTGVSPLLKDAIGNPMNGSLPPEEAEAVEWAADYIQMLINSDYQVDTEHKLSLTNEDFSEVMSGTPDVVNGPVIYDLKWRERDYVAQMAAYALMLMQARDYQCVEVHLLFAERRKIVKLKFNWDSASKIVFDTIAAYRNPDKQPTPCDYCGWCANRVGCAALNERAKAVAAGREDWKLEQYHSSQIGQPVEMAKALKLARQLAKWCEAVEFHAKSMVLAGAELPGFRQQSKAGRQYCTNVAEAFTLSGLTQEKFLAACDIRLNTSKKYPDKQGLADIFAAANEMKKAPAKRTMLKKLEPVLKQSAPSISLVATGETETEEGDTHAEL